MDAQTEAMMILSVAKCQIGKLGFKIVNHTDEHGIDLLTVERVPVKKRRFRPRKRVLPDGRPY